MQRIILVGLIGSGKSTVGDHLIYEHGYFGISFADALKDVVASIFCWDRVRMEGGNPQDRQWRETVDPWWAAKLDIPNFSPRYAMRHIGTEVLREQFNDGLWRLNVERRIEQAGDRPIVVVDGRFREEIDLVVKRMGGQAMLVRRGPDPAYWDLAIRANNGDDAARAMLAKAGVHSSDWDWIGYEFDHVIENDGTIDDLLQRVESRLQ